MLNLKIISYNLVFRAKKQIVFLFLSNTHWEPYRQTGSG